MGALQQRYEIQTNLPRPALAARPPGYSHGLSTHRWAYRPYRPLWAPEPATGVTFNLPFQPTIVASLASRVPHVAALSKCRGSAECPRTVHEQDPASPGCVQAGLTTSLRSGAHHDCLVDSWVVAISHDRAGRQGFGGGVNISRSIMPEVVLRECGHTGHDLFRRLSLCQNPLKAGDCTLSYCVRAIRGFPILHHAILILRLEVSQHREVHSTSRVVCMR